MNMNNHELEFNKATESLRGVRLSDEKKQSMLDHIYKEGERPLAPTPSPFSYSIFFERHRYFMAVTAVVLMITGTAYASSESLPGDPLYALKVQVIEPASLALHFNETARNQYRISLLQERVLEIQSLKDEGRLNFDIESISAAVAQENLSDIEESAVFNATGTNAEVSEHIKTYNNLVEKGHRLETVIKLDIPMETGGDEEKEEKEVRDEDDRKAAVVKETVEEVEKITEETLKPVEDALNTAAEKTEEAAKPAVEEVEEVLEAVTPALKGIGL